MSESIITNQKASLRKKIRATIREMSDRRRIFESDALCDNIFDLFKQEKQRTILLFSPMALEPDISCLIERLTAAGHKTALPLVTEPGKGTMELRAIIDRASLVTGFLDIREPNPAICPLLSPAEIDFALIPGWAFDPHTGARLGKGGGFYDRLAAHNDWRALSIGVAFRCQLIDGLPVEAHDMSVDKIATGDNLKSIR